jgi:hypothetical protein
MQQTATIGIIAYLDISEPPYSKYMEFFLKVATRKLDRKPPERLADTTVDSW